MTLQHRFVESVPNELEEGVLYVSIRFKTVIHACCCGCGRKTVTPLAPTEWKLTFDGKTISLYPSVGNHDFPCKSHYWIEKNVVEWAPQWSEREVAEGRAKETAARKKYLEALEPVTTAPSPSMAPQPEDPSVSVAPPTLSLWQRAWVRIRAVFGR